MGTRGRKSAADLADSNVASIERPTPPTWMSEAEQAEWKEIIQQMPPDWVRRERYPLLEAYCTHAVARRYYAKMLAEYQTDDADAKDIKEWSTMHDAQSKQINSLGIRLEIAQSTSYERNRRNQAKKAPWQM